MSRSSPMHIAPTAAKTAAPSGYPSLRSGHGNSFRSLILAALAIALLSPAQADAQATGPSQASRRVLSTVPVAIAAIMTTGPETTSYGYDAKSRLTKIVRNGRFGVPVITSYEFDRADNRTKLTTTGSNNPPQP